MRPKEVVHRFLASIGRPETARKYLELFQAERKESFALVAVSGAALEDSGNAVVAGLIFLTELELTPVLCVESKGMAEQLVGRLPEGFPIEITSTNSAGEVAARGKIPLLLCVDASQRRAAAQHLRPSKVVFLIGQSGLQPKGQSVRSLVNLRTDFDALVADDILRPSERDLLREIREIFIACSHSFTVSLTSAQDMLRELFTVKGAGTLVRRGTRVEVHDAYSQVDREHLSSLLESAFGRPALAHMFDRPALVIYLATEYQGAAVLEEAPLAPYLSKFAVSIKAQGEGIGGDLWRALTRDHKRFFWRSRPDNEIAPWYASKCDGLIRGQDWTVYWCGLDTSEIAQAVDWAIGAPADFEAQT